MTWKLFFGNIMTGLLITLQKYSAYKYHWSGISLPTQLEITPCSLDQLDPTSNKTIASYNFKDIEGIIGMSRIRILHSVRV